MHDHHRRGWKTSRIFLAVSWIIMLVVALYLFATFLGIFSIGSPVSSGQQLLSLDWGGYVVVSDFANPQPMVIWINGSWTVPKAAVSPDDRFSAIWIGIGGFTDQTLIQTGTEQDSVNGMDVYSAWYELLPNDSTTITTMNVSPGDKITASINLVDSTANEWSIKIIDITQRQSFNHNFFYNSSRLSAEWIVERPTVGNSLGTLANFGSVQFTNASAALTTEVGTITSFPFAEVIMHDRQNRDLVNISSPTSKGSSFKVDYLSIFAVTEIHNGRIS